MWKKLLLRIVLLSFLVIGLATIIGSTSAGWYAWEAEVSVEKVYINGLIMGHERDLDDESYFGEGAWLYTPYGGQKLVYTLSRGPGAEDLPGNLTSKNYVDKFWIVRWEAPGFPSPAIEGGRDQISFGYDGGMVEDCDYKGYDESDAKKWLVNDCRLTEYAPAPTQYLFCSSDRSEANGITRSTLTFPADMHIFDLEVRLNVSDIRAPVSATIDYEGGPPLKLFTEADLGPETGYFYLDDEGSSLTYYGEGLFTAYSGYYQPEEPLETFDGLPLKGDWHLTIDDGWLNEWCLQALAYRTVRFKQPVYQADENGGQVTISVELSETSTKETRVPYMLVPESGGDQEVKNGTLTFAPGQKSQSFTYAIADDGIEEDNEVVTLELGKPTNEYGLSDDSQGVLIIRDDDGGASPTYATLTVDVVGQGRVTISPDQPTYALGETVTLTAAPDPGYLFQGWSGDLSGSQNPAVLTLYDDLAVTATFANEAGEETHILYLPMILQPFAFSTTNLPSTAADSAMETSGEAYTWQELNGSATAGGLGDGIGIDSYPAVATDVYGRPYVAWADDKSGNSEIYLKYWDDNEWRELGGSASAGGISNTPGISRNPQIVVDGNGNLFVAWEDNSYQNKFQIYIKKYGARNVDGNWRHDGDWEEVGAGSASGGGISDSGGFAIHPSLAAYSNSWYGNVSEVLYLAYLHQGATGQGEIYVKMFDTSTGNWEGIHGSATGGGISSTSGSSKKPVILLYGSNPLVAWQDMGDSNQDWDIYVKRLTANGWEDLTGEGSDGNISQTSVDSNHVTMALGNRLYVAWHEDPPSNREIYLKEYEYKNDPENRWLEKRSFTDGGGVSKTSGDSRRPSLAIGDEGIPYLVWQDNSSGDYEIYSLRLMGEIWKKNGFNSASEGGISQTNSNSERPAIALASSGVPYVVWTEGSPGNQKIYLKWWQGWDPSWSLRFDSVLAIGLEESGNQEVALIDGEGITIRNLSQHPAQDIGPSWYGQSTLFFQSMRGGNWDIYQVDADGNNMGKVIEHQAKDFGSSYATVIDYPNWYDALAFKSNRDGGVNNLYLKNLDTNELTRLATNVSEDWRISQSPDNNQLAFSSQKDGQWEIYTILINGSGLRRITNHPAQDYDVDWSPDGRKFAFVSDRDGDSEIYVMNVDGTDVQQLTFNEVEDTLPDWSPDGQLIAFSRENSASDKGIYVIRADGAKEERLTPKWKKASWSVWRP